MKTAIAGEDPNWGRIVMAVGKAGEAADRDQLAIWLGDIPVAKDGEVAPELSRGAGRRLYEEARDRHHASMSAWAAAVATIWTCDLTRRLHRHQCRLPVVRR